MRQRTQRPLRLNTGRVRDQWHTMTRTGKSARLAGHRPEPTIELHPTRCSRSAALADGDIAEVDQRMGPRCLARSYYRALRPGDAFAPMHWTAQVSRAGRINAAVNPAVDPISGQPELKHTPVEIRRLPMHWHGTILARRPVMLPEVSYWTRIKGAGFHAYLLAGEQPIADSATGAVGGDAHEQSRSLARRHGGVGAVIGDGRLEAVMVLGETRDETARDRLAPFMAIGRLSVEQRNRCCRAATRRPRRRDLRLLRRVVRARSSAAIADGASSLDAVGAATQAGTNCGSCRPEIRALIRARARRRKAA